MMDTVVASPPSELDVFGEVAPPQATTLKEIATKTETMRGTGLVPKTWANMLSPCKSSMKEGAVSVAPVVTIGAETDAKLKLQGRTQCANSKGGGGAHFSTWEECAAAMSAPLYKSPVEV
jgi:hypothetical protein